MTRGNPMRDMLIRTKYYEPQGTTTYSTFIDSTDSAYTSTVSASASSSGTVIVGVPSAGYATTTFTEGDTAYTTTLASPSGTSSGTVQVSVGFGHLASCNKLTSCVRSLLLKALTTQLHTLPPRLPLTLPHTKLLGLTEEQSSTACLLRATKQLRPPTDQHHILLLLLSLPMIHPVLLRCSSLCRRTLQPLSSHRQHQVRPRLSQRQAIAQVPSSSIRDRLDMFKLQLALGAPHILLRWRLRMARLLALSR